MLCYLFYCLTTSELDPKLFKRVLTENQELITRLKTVKRVRNEFRSGMTIENVTEHWGKSLGKSLVLQM